MSDKTGRHLLHSSLATYLPIVKRLSPRNEATIQLSPQKIALARKMQLLTQFGIVLQQEIPLSGVHICNCYNKHYHKSLF